MELQYIIVISEVLVKIKSWIILDRNVNFIMKILVIHGANLPLLGKVSSKQKNRLTLDKVDKFLRNEAKSLGFELKIHQLYDESKILKFISTNRNQVAGILLSIGAMSRNFYTLKELLQIIELPIAEIFLSEYPNAKESYQKSVLTEVASTRVLSEGINAYKTGLNDLVSLLKDDKK